VQFNRSRVQTDDSAARQDLDLSLRHLRRHAELASRLRDPPAKLAATQQPFRDEDAPRKAQSPDFRFSGDAVDRIALPYRAVYNCL
jgi:hypothetical protein